MMGSNSATRLVQVLVVPCRLCSNQLFKMNDDKEEEKETSDGAVFQKKKKKVRTNLASFVGLSMEQGVETG